MPGKLRRALTMPFDRNIREADTLECPVPPMCNCPSAFLSALLPWSRPRGSLLGERRRASGGRCHRPRHGSR